MNVGIINAFPMSLVSHKLALNPEVPHEEMKQILHPENWASETEVLWLWGHKNTSGKAANFLRENFGVIKRQEAFGDRPSVFVENGKFFVTAANGLDVEIDKLVILAPVFASQERKAEGQVASAAEVVGFRPILVETC